MASFNGGFNVLALSCPFSFLFMLCGLFRCLVMWLFLLKRRCRSSSSKVARFSCATEIGKAVICVMRCSATCKVCQLPYLHDSNAHLILLNVALKFTCVLQSGSKLKSAFSVPRFSFNASRSWISKFMKEKGGGFF